MEQIISQVVKQLFDQDISVQLTRPDPKFGDFALQMCGVAIEKLSRKGRIRVKLRNGVVQKISIRKKILRVSVAGQVYQCKTEQSIQVLNSLKKEPTTKRAGQTVVIETNC